MPIVYPVKLSSMEGVLLVLQESDQWIEKIIEFHQYLDARESEETIQIIYG